MIAKALSVVCVFTGFASGWLFTMYLVLRHTGYQWRAAIALLLIAQAGSTLLALRSPPIPLLRMLVMGGGALIAVYGGAAVVQNNLEANAHYEGFVDLIGVALVIQGLLTLFWGLASWGSVRARS